jgi:hypothetical protein
MRLTATAVAVLADLLLVSGGRAVAYDVVGAGSWSCEAWQQARKAKQGDVTEQWALGFLAGVAFMSKNTMDPLRGQPPQALAEWLDRYCRQNPKALIFQGAENFSVTQSPVR